MSEVAWEKLLYSFLGSIFIGARIAFFKNPNFNYFSCFSKSIFVPVPVRDRCFMLCYAMECRKDTWAGFRKDENKHPRLGPTKQCRCHVSAKWGTDLQFCKPSQKYVKRTAQKIRKTLRKTDVIRIYACWISLFFVILFPIPPRSRNRAAANN